MNLPLPPVLCHTSGLDEQYTDVQMFEYARAAREQVIYKAVNICLGAGYKSTGIPAYEFMADKIKELLNE